MSFQTNIRLGLRAILRTAAILPDNRIAWEGINFTRPAELAYCRENLIPVIKRLATLNAPQGMIEERFIYQLSFYGRADRGMNEVETLAGQAVDAFKPGTSVSYSGSAAVIYQADQARPLEEPDWVYIPVSIYLWGHRAN